jgi:hypothetical protein
MSRTTRAAATALAGISLFAFAACGSSSGSGAVAEATGTPGVSAEPSPAASASASTGPASTVPSAAASPPGIALNQAIINFQSKGGSSITGGAILTDLGDGELAVTIGVVAAGIAEPMPAHLHSGLCITPDAGVLFELNDLTAGASNTVVKTGLDDMLGSGHSIDIHTSATDDTVVACADIKR